MWSLQLKPEEQHSLYGRFMSLDSVMQPAIAPPREKEEWKKKEIGGMEALSQWLADMAESSYAS